MAEGEQRIEVLEDEMKVLKGEVSRTLVDLRALLMREDSPLTNSGIGRRAPAADTPVAAPISIPATPEVPAASPEAGLPPPPGEPVAPTSGPEGLGSGATILLPVCPRLLRPVPCRVRPLEAPSTTCWPALLVRLHPSLLPRPVATASYFAMKCPTDLSPTTVKMATTMGPGSAKSASESWNGKRRRPSPTGPAVGKRKATIPPATTAVSAQRPKTG